MKNLIRKLSFRNKSPGVLKKSSSALMKLMKSSEKLDDIQQQQNIMNSLPLDMLKIIVDRMNFFEQMKMTRICKEMNSYLMEKWRMIKKLDIRKKDINEATSSSNWHRHSKSYVAIQIIDDTAFMVIDEQWTSGDLYVLLSMMHLFHDWVEVVEMDAPIAELTVVSLSDITLEKWYTFQCLMKAFNNFDTDFHLESDFISDRQIYWPCVRELTIRTKAAQANHLARVLDYGVKSAYVVDRKLLDKLRIVFDDMEGMTNKIVNKHIYHFRCWAGSVGWDHRYETQFLGKV
ncbi:unnamed protein product [Caenorhabditis angaria]|uniref:F-box domain-containing protein n=1 Tax=Caenorhabditis angaria TaxID=860376 RepID=A0A9P1MU30_9PELO|nr:unnamed protein product [Caenorhabditis angaria]